MPEGRLAERQWARTLDSSGWDEATLHEPNHMAPNSNLVESETNTWMRRNGVGVSEFGLPSRGGDDRAVESNSCH